MRFKQDKPIVIGFSGEAGTGKTVTAQALVPGKTSLITDLFWWDHKYFAMPLYAIVQAKRGIEGNFAEDRIQYELHHILEDLFGGGPLYGGPTYDTLVDLVYEIHATPIEPDPEKKPREFLQTVGSLCRAVDKDCFVKWMKRSIIRDGAWALEQEKQYVCLVSDIRMPNEAKMISEMDNGMVIRFTASEEVREERLLNRDGFLMTETQKNHESEKVSDIPAEYMMTTIDTDNLPINYQAGAVIKSASEYLGIALSVRKEDRGTEPGELSAYAED